MALKFIAVLAFAAVASASLAPLSLIAGDEYLPKPYELYASDPRYAFTYGVHDTISGDLKNQIETSYGNEVRGEYSLKDADGFIRTVKYTSGVGGFNAIVDRKPIEKAEDELKTEKIVEAPVNKFIEEPIVKSVSPISYGTPLVQSVPLSYSAPAYINSAPIGLRSPALIRPAPIGLPAPGFIRSASIGLPAPGLIRPALIGLPAPGFIRSAPVGVPAPEFIKSASVGLPAPTFIKSVPILGEGWSSSVVRSDW